MVASQAMISSCSPAGTSAFGSIPLRLPAGMDGGRFIDANRSADLLSSATCTMYCGVNGAK
eukprot:21081-Amphidinium_carterae.1